MTPEEELELDKLRHDLANMTRILAIAVEAAGGEVTIRAWQLQDTRRIVLRQDVERETSDLTLRSEREETE